MTEFTNRCLNFLRGDRPAAPPSRWFWAGLALLIFAAALPRLLSYGYSLPFVDHPDESFFYVAGLGERGLNDQRFYISYPPGIVYLQVLSQWITEGLGLPGTASAIRLVRLTATLLNIAITFNIALSARALADDLAGLLAALPWAIAPLILQTGVYATPDPFVYFFVSLALLLALLALKDPERPALALGSVAAGLLAILFKYPVISAPLPGLLIIGLLALKDFKRHGWMALASLLLIAASAALILLRYDPTSPWLGAGTEAGTAASQGWRNMLDGIKVIRMIELSFMAVGGVWPIGIVSAGLLAALMAPRLKRPRIEIGPTLLVLAIALSIPWLAATFSLADPSRLKDVLPAASLWCVLFGMGLVQLSWLIPLPDARIGMGAATLAALALSLPWLPQSAALVADRMLPDRRIDVRVWFDTNIDTEWVVITDSQIGIFNPLWGGIPSTKWVNWLPVEHFTDHPLSDWREDRGIGYVVLTDEQEAAATEAGLTDEMLLMMRFDSAQQRGPILAVYSLDPPEKSLGADFGGQIQLLGFSQQGESAAGETLQLRFFWRTIQPPPANYSQFVHLVAVDGGGLLAQIDVAPARPERPTAAWLSPGEVLISPWQALTIPALPPGEYRLLTGLYEPYSGQRLAVSVNGDAVENNAVEVLRFSVR